VVELLYEQNAIHYKTSLDKEVSELLSIKINRRGFQDYRMARNCCSWCAYVHNWV